MRTRSLMGVKILGYGSYLPGDPVTNQELALKFGADSEWVERRTGIMSRHYAKHGQATSDLCVAAAEQAIANSGINRADIDLLIVGTFTPDYCCPSTASIVQHRLGIEAAAFDLQAACAGFIYGMATAAQFIATSNAKYALVIGGDCVSRVVAPDDPQMTPLFGDGAGAAVIGKGTTKQGIELYQLGSDGSGLSLLQQPAGGSLNPLTPESLAAGLHYLHMDGKKVFKWAVNILVESIAQILQEANLETGSVTRYFFHQANQRILDAAIANLGLNPEHVHSTLQYSGNTSAASIPVCLAEATRAGMIGTGDRIMMAGFGAGLTWGTALLRL